MFVYWDLNKIDNFNAKNATTIKESVCFPVPNGLKSIKKIRFA